ncbi:hypothetical protein KY290_024314 [Solanum tuberosum]|uniref:Uncharacterized protein n=1 Tax=Solanum tuberosum TaxID=4113 RepID=A0ABQ7US40_SOLTU|nr:hypothetical protein KY290_024314 [Solanum tuberosum]
MAMVMVIADACCFPNLLGSDRCLLVVWKEEDAGVRSLLATVCTYGVLLLTAIIEIEREKGDGAGSGKLGRFGVVSGGLGVQIEREVIWWAGLLLLKGYWAAGNSGWMAQIWSFDGFKLRLENGYVCNKT